MWNREYPLSLTSFGSSPKGTPYGNTGNFPATAKSRPLGEGGIAAGDDGRGKLPQSKPDGFASSLGEGANPLSLLTVFAASSPFGGAGIA